MPEIASAATLTVRLAATIYEAVLLFGVAFAVSYALLASMQWSYPLPSVPRAILQMTLFIVVGAYFVICWTRTGQTLALKAWRLRVVADNGRPPRTGRALSRYLFAWHLWLPGLVIGAAFQLSFGWTCFAAALGYAALLIPALVDREHRLLHERWSGTRLVHVLD